MPNYILEEMKMKELRLEATKRTIKYEKTERRLEKKIVVECIKELERRRKRGEESRREKKRRKVMKKAGINKN